MTFFKNNATAGWSTARASRRALCRRVRLAGAALVLAGVLASCVPPAPPQAVSGGGYELAGYFPRGPYRVTLDASLSGLVGDVEYTLSRLRAITGVDISYAGVASGPLASGELRVQSGNVCIYNGIACDQPYTLNDIVVEGTVTVTPAAFNGWNLRTIILHEFGHLFGLNHWSGSPVQVMNANAEDLGDYQAGDVAGLRAASGH